MAHYINFVRVPALALRTWMGRMPSIRLLETDSVDCRVLPWDIDYNLHLNNSRYLSYMDYARIRLLARLGLLKHFCSLQHTALVGSIDITYRRPLNFGVPFRIDTRMAYWDEKWFYMEQIFYGSSGLAAHAWVKLLFRGPSGNLPPRVIAELLEPGAVSPPLTDRLLQWNIAIRETLHACESLHPAERTNDGNSNAS